MWLRVKAPMDVEKEQKDLDWTNHVVGDPRAHTLENKL